MSKQRFIIAGKLILLILNFNYIFTHHRPSASCSGTESESESSRQKHSTASSITFGRIAQPLIKSVFIFFEFLFLFMFFSRPIVSNESQLNISSDLPINGDTSVPTKAEAMITKTSEVHTPSIDHSHIQIQTLPTRTSTKISREYLTQHITYRAQRLAAKVEPEMVSLSILHYFFFDKYLFSRQYENVVQQHLKNSMKQVLTKAFLLIHQN